MLAVVREVVVMSALSRLVDQLRAPSSPLVNARRAYADLWTHNDTVDVAATSEEAETAEWAALSVAADEARLGVPPRQRWRILPGAYDLHDRRGAD